MGWGRPDSSLASFHAVRLERRYAGDSAGMKLNRAHTDAVFVDFEHYNDEIARGKNPFRITYRVPGSVGHMNGERLKRLDVH